MRVDGDRRAPWEGRSAERADSRSDDGEEQAQSHTRETWRATARRRIRYNLHERFECGIVLTGTEVKSLREGKAQLKDAYAAIRDGEVWLIGLYIPPYGPASRQNHDPERPRKLLLHRDEIERLIGRTREKGLTLVPTRDLLRRRRGRGRRSRSRSRAARTCSTSGRRSAIETWRATFSESCERCGARTSVLGGR